MPRWIPGPHGHLGRAGRLLWRPPRPGTYASPSPQPMSGLLRPLPRLLDAAAVTSSPSRCETLHVAQPQDALGFARSANGDLDALVLELRRDLLPVGEVEVLGLP